MTYYATCLCGNRLAISEADVNKHIVCPACNRALVPVAATPAEAPAAAVPATSGAGEPTKRCPFCGETILAVAKKCRFCNEFLDRAAPAPGGAGSVAAGQSADKSTTPATTPPTFVLTVSQWDNFFRYVICIAIVVVSAVVLFGPFPWHSLVSRYAPSIFVTLLLLTSITASFFYLANRASRCTIWPTRIETETGIFSKTIDALEMFRITDIDLKQNLLQRMLGIGSIYLRTTDATTPSLELYMIPKARQVYRYIQEQVPKADQAHGVVRVEK